MSINHYDLSQPPPQWWSHPNTASIDLNYEDEQQQQHELVIPKDRLFEKPLTPSDVGKLNRLVIPKQHAEKHFPLNGAGGGKEPGENGLLLGFEDEIGKSWRFRYSYWNSSQSYVLTKGWSRFVKEKRLDAGDVVVFARHRVEPGRFFIGWRRRASIAGDVANQNGSWNRVFNSNPGQQYPYPNQYHHQHAGPGPSSSLPYHQHESIHAGTVVQEKQKTSTGRSSKWLRLFGVNLECQQAEDESESSTAVGSPESSPSHDHQYYY